MRNLWKSAVAIIAISASLTTGLAGGATVKAHVAGVVPAPTNVTAWAQDTSCVPDLSISSVPICPKIRVAWSEPDGYQANPDTVSVNLIWGTFHGCLWGTYSDPTFGCFGLISEPRSVSFSQNGTKCVSTFILTNLGSPNDWIGVSISVGNTDGSGNFATENTQLLSTASLPPPLSVGATSGSSSITISWRAPGQSGVLPEGITSSGTFTATASPGGATCTTALLTCTIKGLDPRNAYKVAVAVDYNVGSGMSAALATPVYPMPSSKLAVETIQTAVHGDFKVVISGSTLGSLVNIGVPGKQTTCTANAVGQCTATLSASKPGSYNVLAVSGKQSAVTQVWVPAITVPKGVTHGKSFNVAISHAPPKTAVIVTTNDGRTIKATTNSAGGVSVPVKTTTRAFLSVNVSISGTAFGPYSVQVS